MPSIEEKIQTLLDEEIRPAIQMDGGDIALVSYEDGVAKVRLTGACVGCPMSMMTLFNFVEERLMLAIPEVQEVQQVS